MKKILFVITKSNWGGAQRYVYDLAIACKTQGYDVVVALGGTGEKAAPTGLLKEKLDKERIRVIVVRSFIRDFSLSQELSACTELYKIFRTEKPDIVHLNSSKAGGLGVFVARLTQIPLIIFTAHGLPYDEDRPFYERWSILLLTWLTFLLSHHIILLTKGITARVTAMPFVSQKIHLIQNGIQKPEFLSRKDAHAELQGLLSNTRTVSDERIVIGIIAELHKNKGLSFAIEACTRFSPKRDFYVLIIGSGEEREALETLIHTRNLQDKVHLLGFVRDAARLLSGFDIFLLPSLKEGLPYVLLEAGLAGLSVVASKTGGIPDVIEDEKTGLLVQPGNTSEMSKAIERLLDSRVLRSELGENLKRQITEKFSLEVMVDSTIAVYEKDVY